jgi:hypothetical protein
MYGKSKPDLRERGLELPKQKSNRLTCFFCHSHQISAKNFPQDNNRKYWDKTNMVPKNAKHVNKYMIGKTQCNASKPDMVLGLGTKILSMCVLTN